MQAKLLELSCEHYYCLSNNYKTLLQITRRRPVNSCQAKIIYRINYEQQQ